MHIWFGITHNLDTNRNVTQKMKEKLSKIQKILHEKLAK